MSGGAQEDFSAQGLAAMRRVYEEDGTREIVAAMALDLAVQCMRLERGGATCDANLIRGAAQSLKSAARTAGADALAALWERIEALGEDATLDQAIALAPEAVVRHERLVARLRRELEP
jgi:hypothetical protein